jgi:hypothetical protein
MIVRNHNGHAVGTIDLDAFERAEFVRALSSARQTLADDTATRRAGYPGVARMRAHRARFVKLFRVLSGASLAIVALAMFVAIFADDTATANPAPVTPPAYTAPVGTLPPVAPFSGSTAADARNGWNGIEVDSNGYVLVNGHAVDNVRIDKASPLRVRFLEAYDRNGMTRGNEDNAVREGIAVCQSLNRGDAVTLREAADSRADVPAYGTGERRLVTVSAAIVNFGPRYL